MYLNLFTFVILLPLLVVTEQLPLLDARSTCGANNSLLALRALQHHTTSAFCMNCTTAVETAINAIPTNLATACDSQPSQVSSACSCLVTPTLCPSDAPTQVVQDPGFELPAPTAGFSEGPWTVTAVTAAGFPFGPVPEYDISWATSHSGLGAL